MKSDSVFKKVEAIVDISQYDYESVQVDRTHFHLFGRKIGGFTPSDLDRSLKRMWPLLSKSFTPHPKEVAIVDLDLPLGGGPLEPFIVGIFSSAHISRGHSILIEESTNWPSQGSTVEYINRHYNFFTNPVQAYLDDMLVHELGHLFFGWGISQVAPNEKNDWWFSFGMGLLYDRMAWEKMYSTPSPMFFSLIAKWRNDFANRPQVDQRLIAPDTSKDLEYKLQRLQIYGHGKAYEFLKALRQELSPELFDKVANDCIQSEREPFSYDAFLRMLGPADRIKITELEQKFTVR